MPTLNHFCSVQRVFFPSLNHYPALILSGVDYFKPEGKKREEEKGAPYVSISLAQALFYLRDKRVRGPREGDWHREQQGE